MLPPKEGFNPKVILPIGEKTTYMASAINKKYNTGILGFGTKEYKEAPTYQLPVQVHFVTPKDVDTVIEYLEEIREAMYKEREKQAANTPLEENTFWYKGSDSTGDGFHVVRTKYWKMLCYKDTNEPVTGEKITISYDEYSAGE